ncbi:MAG: carboxypeptidase regulatory-like domain-containing protein [Acidobacteria bacterium]|nr:carboxypeptidase regulatory-like domain-containing protein [Acidobacteriota bacterium]
MKINFSRVFFLTLLLICGFSIAKGQTITGSLEGTVIDEQSNTLSGVLIKLYNLTTGFDYAKLTDSDGLYKIDLLLAGEYRITASKEGYQTTEISRYLIEVNRPKVIKPPPIKLNSLASLTIQINSTATNNIPLTPISLVADDPLQVNIVDATLRGNFAENLISILPLPGIRSFDSLALLLPGVFPSPATKGSNGPAIGTGVGGTGQFSVNGARARSNNFTIDGSDNNDQDIGVRRQGFTPTTSQSVESIKEFQISTLLADAESGRNSGGQINIVSKTGSNFIQGQLHNYFTDSKFNARDFFDLQNQANPKKNPFTRNQFGGILAFPIKKNELQFFGSFELQHIEKMEEVHFVVPSFSEREKAFRFAKNSSKLGRDVLDPSFYPLPNNPGGPYQDNTFTRLISANGDGRIFSLRLDGKNNFLSKPSTFNTRYNFTDDETLIPTVDNALNSSIKAFTRTQNLVLALNLSLTKSISNQTRFSYGRTSLNFAEVLGSPLVFQSRIRQKDRTGDGLPDGSTGPIGRILLAPFSPIGIDPSIFPQGRVNNTFQIADTTIIDLKRHTIKFGFDLRLVELNSFLERNYRTQISFTSGFISRGLSGRTSLGTGVDFAALGLPSSIFQALAIEPNSSLALGFTEINLFLHDQFRLHPRVNLSLGLRYERNSVPTDQRGRLERSLSLKDIDSLVFDPTSVFSDRFFDAVNAQRGFLAGREKIYSADNNNFAPRLSLAWDIRGNGRTSLRAGYGVFYDPILGVVVNQSRNAFPNFIPINFGSAILFPDVLSANPAFLRLSTQNISRPIIVPGSLNTLNFPSTEFVGSIGRLISVGGFFVGAGFGAGITLPEKNLRSPYTQQISFSLEQAFFNRFTLSIAYAATLGKKLIKVRTPNGGQFTTVGIRAISGVTPSVLALLKRPNPALDTVTSFASSANSNYHSLQIAINKRFSTKFFFQTAYTYSHTIDEMSDIFDTAASFNSAQDEREFNLGLKAERASANFDVRHRFSTAFQYQPFNTIGNNRLINILKEINFSGILTLQTGQPFTVNSSSDINFDGNLSDRLDNSENLIISNKGRTRISLPSNISLFSLLALAGNNGAVGRNTFRSQGIASLDLAISKKLKLTQSQTINLRVEAFNIFNRTHFGVPVRILESPGFGSSVNSSLSSRTIQFALTYGFLR